MSLRKLTQQNNCNGKDTIKCKARKSNEARGIYIPSIYICYRLHYIFIILCSVMKMASAPLSLVTAKTWRTFFDQDGRLVNEMELRRLVFRCKYLR